MRTLRYSDRGIDELLEAIDYYETQQAGLGGEFLSLFKSITDNILVYPQMYPTHRDSVRCAFMRKFPYNVFYSVEADNTILVVSIFQAAQSPDSKP